MANLFERLGAGRAPIEKTNQPSQKIQHAQRLLDWLQRWDKPVVVFRDFHNYGPYPRDRESTLSSAKILVENGWLTPLKPHRYDMHKWQVVRRPIVRPDVAT